MKNTQNPIVLVLEDHDEMRDQVSRFLVEDLTQSGLGQVQVRVYPDALQARSDLFSVEGGISEINPSDIVYIVADLRMPGQTGVEFIQFFRTMMNERGEVSPPAVILTGHKDRIDEEEVNALGIPVYNKLILEDMIKFSRDAAAEISRNLEVPGFRLNDK